MTTLRTAGDPARASGPVPGSSGTDATRNHLEEALDRAGFRKTGPRRAVAGLVAGRTGHFTAADLAGEARDRGLGIGRATVFRTLDLLASLGLVERVDLPGGEHAYVACDAVHHHHAICTACGRSMDVADHGLADVLGEIGLRSGFRVTAHRLEIFGLCPACAAGVPRQA